jgi:hypothetical protein
MFAELEIAFTEKCFAPSNFSTCVYKETLSIHQLNTANNTLIHIFVPKLQVAKIVAFFFAGDPA